MKNYPILIAFIFCSFSIYAQNIFPDNGDVLLRGKSIKIELPKTDGGWARGTFFHPYGDINSRIAGYGLQGIGEKPSLLYLAHGKSPWASKLGVYVNTKGNVGIGTIKPEETLHVNGYVRGNLTNGALKIKTQSGYLDLGPQNSSFAHIYTDRPRIIFNKDAYTTTGGFSSYSTANLSLKTNGTERLTIDSSTGNVGIATASPDEKLTVKGKIHAQEVRVDLDGVIAPDYVFEKYYKGNSKLKSDYKILSIAEVETYVKKNHHLPEIPSATEMDKNGVYLKEMNLKLLQKIEELTLYTIQQEKEIQLQKVKNESLENRMDALEMVLKANKK